MLLFNLEYTGRFTKKVTLEMLHVHRMYISNSILQAVKINYMQNDCADLSCLGKSYPET